MKFNTGKWVRTQRSKDLFDNKIHLHNILFTKKKNHHRKTVATLIIYNTNIFIINYSFRFTIMFIIFCWQVSN